MKKGILSLLLLMFCSVYAVAQKATVSGTIMASNVSFTAVFEKLNAAANKTNQDSSKGSNATNQEMVGEPVNVITGNFYDECDDMILNNVGDARLALTRSYNSMDTESGLLGSGWHMNLESTLVGPGAIVRGFRNKLNVGENSEIKL